MLRRIKKAFYKNYDSQKLLSVLHQKVCAGDLEAVEDLVGLCANLEATIGGENALRLAVVHRKLEVVRFLLKKGASVTGLNARLQTVLMGVMGCFVYDALSLEIVKLLLAQGVNVAVSDLLGETALHQLLRHHAWKDPNKHALLLETLSLLLKAGSNVRAKNAVGEEAIHLIIQSDAAAPSVALLMQYGADCNVPNSKGIRIFHQAVFWEDPALVLQLLQQKDLLLNVSIKKDKEWRVFNKRILNFFESNPAAQALLRARGVLEDRESAFIKHINFRTKNKDPEEYKIDLLANKLQGLRRLIEKAFEHKKDLWETSIASFLVFEDQKIHIPGAYLLFLQNRMFKFKDAALELVFQNVLGALKAAVEPKMTAAYQGLEDALKEIEYDKFFELLLKQYWGNINPESEASAILYTYYSFFEEYARREENDSAYISWNCKKNALPQTYVYYPAQPLLGLRYLVLTHPRIKNNSLFDIFRTEPGFEFLGTGTDDEERDDGGALHEASECLRAYFGDAPRNAAKLQKLQKQKDGATGALYFPTLTIMYLRCLVRMHSDLARHPMFDSLRQAYGFEFLPPAITLQKPKKTVHFQLSEKSLDIGFEDVGFSKRVAPEML